MFPRMLRKFCNSSSFPFHNCKWKVQKEANLQADEHQKEGEVKTAWNSSLCLILGPAKYLHNRFRQKHSYNEEIYENDEEKLIVAVLKTLKTVQVMLGLDARRRKAEQ